MPGEHFVIGETSSCSPSKRADVAADALMPVQQQSFSPQYLKEIPSATWTTGSRSSAGCRR